MLFVYYEKSWGPLLEEGPGLLDNLAYCDFCANQVIPVNILGLFGFSETCFSRGSLK